jgi:hypothetical protein
MTPWCILLAAVRGTHASAFRATLGYPSIEDATGHRLEIGSTSA